MIDLRNSQITLCYMMLMLKIVVLEYTMTTIEEKEEARIYL